MSDHRTPMLTSGTCIVAIRTPDEIVIGADSFERVCDGKQNIVCKIGIVGDIVFATAGLSRVFDDETFEEHFNVREIVRGEIDPQVPIEENLRRIVSAVAVKAKAYFAIKLDGERLNFLKALNKPLEIILGRYEENTLRIAAGRLMRKAPDDSLELGASVLRPCRFPGLHVECYLAGACDAILQDFEFHRLMETPDLVGTVEDAILIQARKDESVGGPIRIIQVTESGVRWRREQEGCG